MGLEALTTVEPLSDGRWAFAAATAGILDQNLSRCAGNEAATILTAIEYRDPGIDRRQAEIRARGLLRFTASVVEQTHPEMIRSGRLLTLASVIWAPARRLEVVPS